MVEVVKHFRDPRDEPGPLACLVCGVSTPAGEGSYFDQSMGGTLWRWAPPGRRCAACTANITRAGDVHLTVAVLQDFLDASDPAAGEIAKTVLWYCDVQGMQSMTSPFDEGSPERWAHIDAESLVRRCEEARAARSARAVVDTTPRASSSGGCGGCGVRLSAGWPERVRGAGGVEMDLCAECSAHSGKGLLDWLAGRAGGLLAAPFAGFAQRIGFNAYVLADPGGAGSDAPFGWMGDDLPKLQRFVAENWPAQLADPVARAAALDAARERDRPAAGLLLG